MVTEHAGGDPEKDILGRIREMISKVESGEWSPVSQLFISAVHPKAVAVTTPFLAEARDEIATLRARIATLSAERGAREYRLLEERNKLACLIDRLYSTACTYPAGPTLLGDIDAAYEAAWPFFADAAAPAAEPDREKLGRVVRAAWVQWARQQPDPKPSWLLPYDELPEAEKEADRQIGEAVIRASVAHTQAVGGVR